MLLACCTREILLYDGLKPVSLTPDTGFRCEIAVDSGAHVFNGHCVTKIMGETVAALTVHNATKIMGETASPSSFLRTVRHGSTCQCEYS